MRISHTHLQVSQFIKAKREKVYQAWVDPKILQKWFCPENMKPGKVEAEVRVGGVYRSSMIDDREIYTAMGVYREIIPNQKLVFTHGWEGPDWEETVVTVVFMDQDGGTLVMLTHERLADPESVQGHAEGWALTLKNLENLFN